MMIKKKLGNAVAVVLAVVVVVVVVVVIAVLLLTLGKNLVKSGKSHWNNKNHYNTKKNLGNAVAVVLGNTFCSRYPVADDQIDSKHWIIIVAGSLRCVNIHFVSRKMHLLPASFGWLVVSSIRLCSRQ